VQFSLNLHASQESQTDFSLVFTHCYCNSVKHYITQNALPRPHNTNHQTIRNTMRK